ncbi:MAG TPA: ABC transporter permease, partial [Anaerolineales bacterium]
MFRRIWSLTIKEFIHLRNDWWLPAFMVLGGALELLLVGWATSRPISNLPIMVLDHDRSAASRALVISLENTETFSQPQYVSNVQTIEDALVRGKINAAVVIPPDYEEQMASSTGRPTLLFLLNGA